MDKLEDKIRDKIPAILNSEYYVIEKIILDNINLIEEQKDQKVIKKEITINKYSQNREGDLFESILIENESYFVNVDGDAAAKNNDYENIKITSSIEENTRILNPPSLEECPHIPYSFLSNNALIRTLKQTKENETVFSLYKKAKAIVSRYIDQDDYIINLTTIDIIFSYFQDRFNTTHYTGVFGDNGSGKSSIGDVMEALAYRALNTTDPTPPNIFRSLGTVEAGQITLILDEAEKIDQSQEMMSILKTGYDFRKKVSRINQFTGKPERFCTYCLKLIIGEKPPGQYKAKGIMDRTFSLSVFNGDPKNDIKEVLNPTDTGGEENKTLLKEITDFRNTLLAYRLLHFKDRIKNIDIGIKGRNKELIKPCLQLFFNTITEEDKKTYKEIEDTFEILLKTKNSKRDFSLEAALLPIIVDLMYESKKRTITFADFWYELRVKIKGYFDERRPSEYHTEEFGIIYRNSISNILQKLGVESKHRGRFTELIFKKKEILKNALQYNCSIQTKLDDIDSDETCEHSEHSERIESSLETTEENKHKIDDVTFKESNEKVGEESKIDDYHNKNDVNSNGILDPSIKNNSWISQGYSQFSQYSQASSQGYAFDRKKQEEIQENIYRVGRTDTWACRCCKNRGDKWYMRQHPCSGLKKGS